MRLTALAGLLAFVIVTNVNAPKVSAAESGPLSLGSSSSVEPAQSVLVALGTIGTNSNDQNQTNATTTVEVAEVTHTVIRSETLSAIAKQYETTWQRLYDKNVKIENPDSITVGDILTIPNSQENLTSRELPVEPKLQPIASTNQAPKTAPVSVQTTSAPRSSSAGNTYARGWCTWYAKNRRGDLPNSLGNANTWVARARAQGIPTGSTPQVGAIGQQGMHVVFVEQVNADGTVLVSEMNYVGFNVISTRTAAASSFQYIY